MSAPILLATAGLAMLATLTACGSVSSPGRAGSGAGNASSGMPLPGGSTPPSASSPSASPSPPSAAVTACHARQLRIRLVRGGAEGGTASGDIGFTNTSGTPCRLSGWPSLVAVTAGGTQRTARHVLTTEFGPHISAVPVVTLAPGARAEAVFTAGDTCGSGQPATYKWLSITAPGTGSSTSISAYLPYLGAYLPACGPVSVTPVAPSSVING